MNGHENPLAIALAASDAYASAGENLTLIDAAVEGLRDQVDISDEAFAELVERLHSVLDTNRAAPAVMRIMAYADAARQARAEAVDPAHGWRQRRSWRKLAERANDDLLAQLATTLDALLTEPY